MDKQNHGGIAADPFDSVTAFYMQHKHLLFQEAWKYLTQLEDVEDVVCETLARLLENIEKFIPWRLPSKFVTQRSLCEICPISS